VGATVKQEWFVIPSDIACYQTAPLVVIKQGARRTISGDELYPVTLIPHLPNGPIINKKVSLIFPFLPLYLFSLSTSF